jgi:hypothetical protein
LRQDLLFYGQHLSGLLFAYPDMLTKDIEGVSRNAILNTSLSDLADHLVAKYTCDIPRLRPDLAHQLDPEDVPIDVSYDISRSFRDDGPHYLQGTQYTLVVPFEGDPDFFGFQPSTFYSSGVRGEVRGQTLVFRHRQLDADGAAVKRDFDQMIAQVAESLEIQRRDTQDWNAKLPQKVRDLLEARKKKALEAVKLAASLEFPLKQREGAAYAVPVTRKRVVVDMPTPKTGSYAPEPELKPEVYEEILRVIRSLSLTMERSPSAFATMGEEHLRDHILVSLNGQFEGAATGETFNRSGKTDILIREKDRNVFIAECKFWDGPKSLIAAIDQILSYLSWRDSKVALIIFNRRKDISAVLAAIPETVAQHPLFKKQLEYKSEGAFRFLFGQKDDRNRELILTVMVFDVPGAPTEEVVPVAAPASPAALASAPASTSPRRKR